LIILIKFKFKGPQGEAGPKGPRGQPGRNGADGMAGEPGKDAGCGKKLGEGFNFSSFSQIIVRCQKQNPDIRKEIVVQFTLNSNLIVKKQLFYRNLFGFITAFFYYKYFHSIRLIDD
jgi:hypothetical protein